VDHLGCRLAIFDQFVGVGRDRNRVVSALDSVEQRPLAVVDGFYRIHKGRRRRLEPLEQTEFVQPLQSAPRLLVGDSNMWEVERVDHVWQAVIHRLVRLWQVVLLGMDRRRREVEIKCLCFRLADLVFDVIPIPLDEHLLQ